MTAWSEASAGFGGHIEDFPLTSVLQILELGKKSGFLYVRSFPKIAFLVFGSGAIIQVVSSQRRAGLGELLIAEGLVSQEDLSAALETQRHSSTKQMLGEIFESMGHVDHKQVIDVLTKQMKDIVHWVLAWKEGEFTFYAGEAAVPELTAAEEEMVLPVGIIVQDVLKAMEGSKDQRKHPRVPVSLKVIHQAEGESRTYYTRDVSGGGLYILADQLAAQGEAVDLELWIPMTEKPTQIKCRIVRVDEGIGGARGFAVEFIQIDDHSRGVLKRLGDAMGDLL